MQQVPKSDELLDYENSLGQSSRHAYVGELIRNANTGKRPNPGVFDYEGLGMFGRPNAGMTRGLAMAAVIMLAILLLIIAMWKLTGPVLRFEIHHTS